MATRTLFHAGSLAKSLSAAATLTLVEQGFLDLDEDANKCITSWRVPEYEFTQNEKATLRRLLIHSAGIKDGLTDRGPDDPMPAYITFGDAIPAVTLQQLLACMSEEGVAATQVFNVPGSSYHYANADYAIFELWWRIALVCVLRILCSGLYLIALIYKKQLSATPLCALAGPFHQRTHNGRKTCGRWAGEFSFPCRRSLWTTPGDLSLFMIYLMKSYQVEATHLLTPQMGQEMLSSQIEICGEPLADSSGLGFELKTSSQRLVVFHTRGTWGSCNFIWFYPQLGKGAVVMANSASSSILRFEILLSIAMVYGWPMN